MKEDINSIIENLDFIDSLRLQDVYDYYRHLHDDDGSNNDDSNNDVEGSEEKNIYHTESYERLNKKLKKNNVGVNYRKKTVFLSHSHEDFGYACRVALFLRTKYNVDVYIDELDSLMPLSTNSYTAEVLSKKIRKCDRFIFVGTKSSFKSKWCNWELGVADFKRASGHLAFFVMNDHPAKNGNYRKNEYVGLYPFIWDRRIIEADTDKYIPKDGLNEEDLFVGYFKNFYDRESFVTLKDWLNNDENYFAGVSSAEINRKKTIAAFYISKFKDDAINALGCTTLSNAFSYIASCIGGKDNTYMFWRRREFNILFENEKNAYNDYRLYRIVINFYNKLNGLSFE